MEFHLIDKERQTITISIIRKIKGTFIVLNSVFTYEILSYDKAKLSYPRSE